jgi:hypothetical protein
MLFEQYTKKFNYRITPKLGENAKLGKVELYFKNGEFNTTHSEHYKENTMRAKPYKIVLRWEEDRLGYCGYFWLKEKKMIEIFENFYKNDTQKEGELFIEIGNSNKDFKISLKDSSTTIEIPTEEMEIIVFKNKFEFFKSKNYKRPKGGWRN